MRSMQSLKQEGIIPESYQSICECGHPLYTNPNMTEVMCLSEQCIYRGGNKLAYALKIMGIKNIGVQKSITLVNLPGVKTHMDIFGITDNNIKDVESNLLDLPIIPLDYKEAQDGKMEVVFINKNFKYHCTFEKGIGSQYLSRLKETSSRLEISTILLEVITTEIYPKITPEEWDLLETRLYGCTTDQQIIQHKLHLIEWYKIANKYIDTSYDNLPIYIPSEEPITLNKQWETKWENTKSVRNKIAIKKISLNEEENKIIDTNERTSYDYNWILENIGQGVATLTQMYEKEGVSADELNKTLAYLIATLSNTVLNDGRIVLELNPIIEFMKENRQGLGIQFYKFMQLWNFTAIGETYTQKIFMEFSNPEEFYNRFEEENKSNPEEGKALGYELSIWLSEKLNMASYTQTIQNIINVMNDYKEDIIRVSKYFKFRPGTGNAEGEGGPIKPLLVTITNSIATRNPHTGKVFSPRESFIDFCIEEYGIPIVYSKAYTSSIDYIIADDRSGGNKKLKHTEKIIGSEDFMQLLVNMKDGNQDKKQDGQQGGQPNNNLEF